MDFILLVERTSYLTSCTSSELNMMFVQRAKWNTHHFYHILFLLLIYPRF